MICPHCERYLEDGVAFCIYCGQRLGKYADDASEGASTINLSDAAVPEEGQAAVASDASGSGMHAAAGAAAATAAAAAAAPVAPASARESARAASTRPSVSGRSGSTGRLHADDEMARRMGEIDDEEGSGKGRKVLAGVIIAGLAAAAIGFGAAYVAPSIMGGGDSGSSTSQVTSSSTESSSSSSSASKSSSSSKSSKSTKSSSADTKRGATVERANSADNDSSNAGTNGNGNNNGGTNSEIVAANPTTGEETTTGIVNTYTPAPSLPSTQGFSGATATATSISPTEGNVTHGPDLVLDGRPETAWNTNEDGVGQSITISVNANATVNGLKVMNGYNKISASGTDLYYANARAKKILIEYETGAFEYTLKDLKGEYQDIPFKDPQPTNWMKITIKSVYPGDLYDDCCISEIDVY